MKYLLSLLTIAAMLVACETTTNESQSDATADAAAFDVSTVSFYGEAFEPATPMNSEDLTSRLEAEGGLTNVQVTGEVLAACQMKGCWMKMPLADGKEMRVTFKDYGFFVPKDCAGQTAIITGKAYYDTTSVEDLRHYAVDGGMTEEEAAAKYTEPEIAISFEATGVALPKAAGMSEGSEDMEAGSEGETQEG